MTSSFTISGVVKIIVTCMLTKVSQLEYRVHEISNSPLGYQVYISTNQNGTYNSIPFNNNSIVTNIYKQEDSIDIIKTIKFTSVPSYANISCIANE